MILFKKLKFFERLGFKIKIFDGLKSTKKGTAFASPLFILFKPSFLESISKSLQLSVKRT